MRFIKQTTWQEVFKGWSEQEANNPGWIRCATEIKGWPDWESWRNHTAEQSKFSKSFSLLKLFVAKLFCAFSKSSDFKNLLFGSLS